MAASCIVERIKCDREVDVFQSIKQMRQNRSQLICNMVSWAVLGSNGDSLELLNLKILLISANDCIN